MIPKPLLDLYFAGLGYADRPEPIVQAGTKPAAGGGQQPPDRRRFDLAFVGHERPLARGQQRSDKLF